MRNLQTNCNEKRINISTCNIMGVNIAAINMKWLISYINNNINLLKGDYICVANVHTTVMAYDNPEYLEIQNGGIMAIPDGGPLSTIGRKRGFSDMQRITGPSLMEAIFEKSNYYNYTHFFYGSTQETLNKLKDKLIAKYPNLKIVGIYSPPFRELNDDEDENIVKIINDAKPDFVWVGLGAPKQEVWMAKHQGIINGLMIGVGAGFDYLAGNIKRAPKWMQDMNLEWLYRLLQDPKRLFYRYLYSNSKFIWNAIILKK